MAITKILNIKSQSNLHNAIEYILKPEKTKEQLWVGGNAGNTTQEVYRTMMDTKQTWGKLDGRKGYHIIISWKPGECTEEKAYQIIQEFCQEYLGENYDYVFGIHTDRKHCHGHVVFNSVNRVTGYKYRYERGDWEKFMQPITDKLCVKYGLPKLKYDKGNQKGVSYGEWKDGGKSSWKKMIRADIDYAISKSETYEEFLEQMGSMHYQIQEGTSREEGEILSLKLPGQKKYCRTKKKTLGEAYTVVAIRERIGKEWKRYPYPKSPKIKVCRSNGRWNRAYRMGGYQASHIRDIYEIQNRYAKGNPYAANAGSMRKHLLEIRKLRDDCRYLVRMDIRSRAALEQREREVLQEEKRLKQQRSLEWEFQNHGTYQKYQELENKLAQIPAWEDRFEQVLDELESLQAQLPNGVDQIQTGKEQLQEIRQEKRLIRQIKQMDEEHKQIRAFPKQSLHSGSKEIRWDPKKPQRKGGKKWKRNGK